MARDEKASTTIKDLPRNESVNAKPTPTLTLAGSNSTAYASITRTHTTMLKDNMHEKIVMGLNKVLIHLPSNS